MFSVEQKRHGRVTIPGPPLVGKDSQGAVTRFSRCSMKRRDRDEIRFVVGEAMETMRRNTPVAAVVQPSPVQSSDAVFKWFALLGPFLTILIGIIGMNMMMARLDERSKYLEDRLKDKADSLNVENLLKTDGLEIAALRDKVSTLMANVQSLQTAFPTTSNQAVTALNGVNQHAVAFEKIAADLNSIREQLKAVKGK